MLQKQIIFKDGEKKEEAPLYIIPQHLPYINTEHSLITFASNEMYDGFNLRFRNFMPLGLMHQLIVKFGNNPERKYYYEYVVFL